MQRKAVVQGKCSGGCRQTRDAQRKDLLIGRGKARVGGYGHSRVKQTERRRCVVELQYAGGTPWPLLCRQRGPVHVHDRMGAQPVNVARHGAVVVEGGLLDDEDLAVDISARPRQDRGGADIGRARIGTDHDGRGCGSDVDPIRAARIRVGRIVVGRAQPNDASRRASQQRALGIPADRCREGRIVGDQTACILPLRPLRDLLQNAVYVLAERRHAARSDRQEVEWRKAVGQ